MGTVRLTRGSDSVDFVNDVVCQRSVGRPGSDLSRIPAGAPLFIDKQRAFSDIFEVSAVFAGSTARADARTLRRDILRDPLGSGALELEFVGALWDLGTFQVVPIGNRAGRFTWNTGEKEFARVDNLELRVVQV